MRKYGIIAVTTIALALTGTALASGNPSGHGGLVVLSGKTVQLNLVDAGEPGFTLGDQVAFSDDFGGKQADGGVCTLTRIADAGTQSGTAQCQVTYSLKNGQITTQGLLTLSNGGFTGTQRAAITGGTGAYRDAGGEATLEFIRPGELKVTLGLR